MKGVGGVTIRPKEIGMFNGKNELILETQGMKFPVVGFTAVLITLYAIRIYLISSSDNMTFLLPVNFNFSFSVSF